MNLAAPAKPGHLFRRTPTPRRVGRQDAPPWPARQLARVAARAPFLPKIAWEMEGFRPNTKKAARIDQLKSGDIGAFRMDDKNMEFHVSATFKTAKYSSLLEYDLTSSTYKVIKLGEK